MLKNRYFKGNVEEETLTLVTLYFPQIKTHDLGGGYVPLDMIS